MILGIAGAARGAQSAPARTDMHTSAIAALVAARGLERPAFTFLDAALQPTTLRWCDVAEQAERRATALIELGVQPLDRIGLALNDNDQFVLTFFACLLAGAVPVPIQPAP